MSSAPSLSFVVPAGLDDPARVSGGNVYDRRVRDGLRRRGWRVNVLEAADAGAAAAVLRGAPVDVPVLVDGLVAGWAPQDIEAAADRMRLVVLAHMVVAAFPQAAPAAIAAERRVLRAARKVIATSRWTAGELARRGLVDGDRTAVAPPGAEPAATSRPSREGALLCVGVVAPHKGQDILLEALARLDHAEWTCVFAGSMDHDRRFAERMEQRATAFGSRVEFAGVLGGDSLEDAYHGASLLVAPSRVESSGIAVAEARARAVPVLAAAVGGIPDTVSGGGALLVPPDDPAALAACLEGWMADPVLRCRLRGEAEAARRGVPTWDDTVQAVADALEAG